MRSLVILLLVALSGCALSEPRAPAPPPGAFASASAADRALGDDRFAVRVQGLWGYIDRTGALAVPPRFLAARPFHEGRAAVRTADGWGFVDPAGRLAVAPVWADVSDFAGGRARVSVQTESGARDGFVDAEGARVLADALEAYDFAGGLAPVRRQVRYTPFGVRLLRPVGATDVGPWTLVGPDGAEVARLDAAAVASGSVAPSGAVLFPFSRAAGPFARATWGWLDAAGGEAIAPRFDAVGGFAEGLAPAAEGGRFGFVDEAGAFRIPPRFEVAVPFSDGRARVRLDGRWGFVRADGAFAGAPEWDGALDATDGRAAVLRGDVWGYLGADGALALPLRYAFATPFRNGLARVRDADGAALIDTTGAVVWRGE